MFKKCSIYYEIRMKDEKDKKIVRLLKQNARISNVEIARHVGLSEGAVRARIERLVREGTIRKFTIEAATGSESLAVIMVKAKGNTKTMMKEIVRLQVAQHAYEISGAYDGCVVIEGENMAVIDKKIDLLRALKNVQDTRTFIVLKKW